MVRPCKKRLPRICRSQPRITTHASCVFLLLFRRSREYGLVYSYKLLGLGTFVNVCDPDLIQKIFVKYVALMCDCWMPATIVRSIYLPLCFIVSFYRENLQKSPLYKMFSAVVGSQSLLFTPKDKWVPKRKAFAPGFAPKFLKDMVNTMIEKLERFEACIESDIAENKATNMLARTQTFTSDVIVAVAFGEDWGGDVNTQHPARVCKSITGNGSVIAVGCFAHFVFCLLFIHAGNSELARLIEGTLTDPFRSLRFKTNRQIREYERLIDEEMMRILERRLADHTPGEKKDICSIAVEEMRREGGPLTYDDKVSISHQLKTFYFAGHDTTATTISWSIWLLSQKPHILAEVRAELKEHGVWTDSGKPPTYDDLQKCTYLEAVIKETLRLYPAATGVSRYTDDVEEEWNGYRLSGAILVMGIYAMGRHPLLWKDPETYRPERFLDGSEDPPNSKYSVSAKFTAFSRGPRDCMGKYFALIESKLAISALVTRFDFECVDPTEHMKVLVTTLPSGGAAVRFRPRAT